MESTHLNVSSKTPLTNDASSTSKKSICKNSFHPDNNELDQSYCDFTSFDHISSTNKEDKVKDKGIWKYLKNKLKPKKKEKNNFVSYVEPSGRQNSNQDHLSYTAVHHRHLKHESHFVDYSFVSPPNRMFFKENKFRASTIDSRRLNNKNTPGRSKKEAKLIVANKNFNTRFLYLCDGTAQRIDQWLAESEAFMKTDENKSAVATAVVGPHIRRSSQPAHIGNQTPKQNRKYDTKTPESSKHTNQITKQPENAHSIQDSINKQPPDETSINLFRQSSRSVNHLPVSRNKVDMYIKSRPSSHYENQGIVCTETTKPNEQSETGRTVDVPELKSFTNTENSIIHKPKSTQKSGLSSNEASCKVEVNSTSSCLTNNSPDLQNLTKTSRPKCTEFETIGKKELNSIPPNLVVSVRSKMSSLSSESLKSLSCNESYCTDYTPFGEEIKNLNIPFYPTHLNSETPFSHKSEPNIENIISVGIQKKITKPQIPAENSLFTRRGIFYRDRPKMYQTPQVAKFVTTIFLTGDEINLDNLPINDSHNATPHQRVNNQITHRSSVVRKQQTTEKWNQNIFQTSQVGLKPPETMLIDTNKEVPSNIFLTKKGTEIYPISPHRDKFDGNKNDEDLHLDIDIFDYKTKNTVQEMDACEYNAFFIDQYSKENCSPSNVKNESVLFTNIVGTFEDFKSARSTKISEIENPTSHDHKNLSFVNNNYPFKESFKADNFKMQSQKDESSDLEFFESNNEFLTPNDFADESPVTLFLSDHEVDEKTQSTNKNSDDESSVDVFDETTSPCQTNLQDEVPSMRKMIHPRAPKNERHSPPLNSFTSRSSFSLFDKLSNSSKESLPDSMASPFHDFKKIDNASNNKETQSHLIDKSISPPDLQKYKTKKAFKDPNLDLRAFMSVRHNDHARIFDLCFGNSPSFLKTSQPGEGSENLKDEQISDWKDVDHATKSDDNSHALTKRYIKNGSNLHTFNLAKAFYV